MCLPLSKPGFESTFPPSVEKRQEKRPRKDNPSQTQIAEPSYTLHRQYSARHSELFGLRSDFEVGRYVATTHPKIGSESCFPKVFRDGYCDNHTEIHPDESEEVEHGKCDDKEMRSLIKSSSCSHLAEVGLTTCAAIREL